MIVLFLAVANSQTAAALTTTSSVATTNGQQKDTTWTKLFVGGLPYHTTDKSLRVSSKQTFELRKNYLFNLFMINV